MTTDLNLFDYIPHISPEFKPPYHLPELVDLFERIKRGESIRACVSYAIRHRKTETTLHGLLWLLEHDPTLRIVLMTHSHERAQWLGKRLRKLARRTDVGPTRGSDTIAEWENAHGGGVLIMSADMSREGYDCHILLCDDPIDEKNVISKEKRDDVDDGIAYYSLRCMRNGVRGSVIICASRFDRDDPVGRRLARTQERWEYYHQPAIVDLGLPTERAFAPDVWPLEALKQERAVLKEKDPYERVFWARLQGDPKPEGGAFGPPSWYITAPTWAGFRDGAGFDLSYTRNKRSDWSSICVGRLERGTLYILQFWRFKAELNEALEVLRGVKSSHGQMPVYSFMSGPEIAVARYMAFGNMPIQYMKTSEPKFTRARRTIDAYNAGRIVFPKMQPGIAATLDRIQNWKGVEDDPDDEADALVSLWEGMVGRGSGGIGTTAVQPRRTA